MPYIGFMRVRGLQLLTLLLIVAILPGFAELVEGAVHLVIEGHLAHAEASGDHHGPTEPEHGCTPLFHFCGCHANLAGLGPELPPELSLDADRFDRASGPRQGPPGHWPPPERPPRA